MNGAVLLSSASSLSAGFRLVALSVLVILSGCAGQQTAELLAKNVVSVPQSAIAGTHAIFVATTRAKAKDAREVYSGARSDSVSYARVDMSVPAIHETGAIERPVSTNTVDPAKYMTAMRIAGYEDSATFKTALNADIARHGGRAMVFIHGYNTKFDGAIYRMTQIVHDSGYTGTPILFSWASGGRTVDYVYDNNSATAARDGLLATLRLIERSGAKRIDIVAHSMGNWVTMEALRELAVVGDRNLGGKLGDVVLASPDVDVDVFKSQMRRYGVPEKPFFVLTSANDRALNISGLIAGNRPRVGDYSDAKDLASYGVIVADLSNVSAGDALNHTKFADNPVLVKLLGERLAGPDDVGINDSQITNRVDQLARGVGQTITSAAEIIITTPVDVLRIAVGE